MEPTKEITKPTKEVIVTPPTKLNRFRLEPLLPSGIIDSWRLFERSLKEAAPEHPSLGEETPEQIRNNLFKSITTPGFEGIVAKHGKKPVGQITGFIMTRALGSPRVFYSVWLLWVEPEYRKQGVAKLLTHAMARKLKGIGVHHWESQVDLSKVDSFKVLGEIKQVATILAGPIKLE